MKKRTDNGAREENYLEIKHFLTVRQSNKVFFGVVSVLDDDDDDDERVEKSNLKLQRSKRLRRK